MTAPTLTLPGVTDITATSARPQVTLTYAAAEIATGGTITDYNDGTDDWKIHTFDSSDELITTQEIDWEYLVVAGGGGGAIASSGGAGAGGFRKFVAGEAGNTGAGVLTLAADTYTITVGAGGPGAIYDGTSTTSLATEGNPSSVAALSVSDGGGAGVTPPQVPGASHDGGSGGGGRGDQTPGSGGSGTAPQGHDGGDGYRLNIDGTQNALTDHGGGGGGASEAGTSPSGTTASPNDIIGGDGGDGIETSISGTATYYAGGGGGGAGTGSYTIAGLGGLGGGGDGSRGSGVSGNPGTANTGGGGGGASRSKSGTAYTGGTGGSGRVILRRKVV